MSQRTKKISAKHGVFQFCINDEFIGLALNQYGEFSEIELSIMNKFIKKNDIVFDIGSNIGAFTVPFAKKVGINGKVFAFEPQPFIYNILKKNIELNRICNVKLFKNGVGEKKKTIKIDEMDYSYTGNFGVFTLTSKYLNTHCGIVKEKKKNSVNIVKLDDFLNLKKCNFIKIDVEYMEMAVLKGGKNFLKKNRPILWIENHWKFPNQINKYLLEIGYNPYWAITRIYNPKNYFINDKNIYDKICTTNILAIPDNKIIEYESLGLTKVFNSFTKPTKVVIESLN